MYDLVQKYPNLDFSEILPNLSKEQKAELLTLSCLKKNPTKKLQVLAAHHLFSMLDGNPFSIKTVATFYKNPNVAYNDLLGIYERLLDTNEEQVDKYGGEENALATQKSKIHDAAVRRIETRRKGIQAILEVLQERSGDEQLSAISLFFFLGCFEMGLIKDALYYIWPNEELDNNLYLLKRLGVLEIGAPRVTLTALLTNYVSGTQFKHCERTLMKELCSFYETEIMWMIFDCDVPIDEETLRSAQ